MSMYILPPEKLQFQTVHFPFLKKYLLFIDNF